MGIVAFDTLKFADRLQSGGFSEPQARATAQAFAEASAEQLVTKSDLREALAPIQTELTQLNTKIDKVETRLSAELTQLDAKIDKVDAKIDKVETRLSAKISILRWMAGFTLAGMMAIFYLLIKQR